MLGLAEHSAFVYDGSSFDGCGSMTGAHVLLLDQSPARSPEKACGFYLHRLKNLMLSLSSWTYVLSLTLLWASTQLVDNKRHVPIPYKVTWDDRNPTRLTLRASRSTGLR
jgi:hypothetical protein